MDSCRKKKSELDEILSPKRRRHVGHLVIDAQRVFCDPRYNGRGNIETAQAVEKASRLTPVFRRAGLSNYIVYYGKKGQVPKSAGGGLFKVKPKNDDIIVRKTKDSAFEGSNLPLRLRRNNIHNLIISGVNFNACIYYTALDAVFDGFKVWVMRDCVANDNENDPSVENIIVEELTECGVSIINSPQILSSLLP